MKDYITKLYEKLREAMEKAIRLADDVQKQQRHPIKGGVQDPLAKGPEV